LRSQLAASELGSAAAFETRWTLQALQRVDPELHRRLVEQKALWHEALMLGEIPEVDIQFKAMCRGWIAAARRMEAAGEPDDAYMLGQHGGTVVAIGPIRSGLTRTRELQGNRVVWLTPDEVAAMFAGAQSLAMVKELWPDSEVVRIVDKYPDEPAKED
jgi:hypothetical protein